MKKFLAIAALSLACSACIPEKAMVPVTGVPARTGDAEMRSLSANEKAIVRRGVVETLPNPSFAEFRWTKFPKNAAESEYYCGQLNAQVEQGRWVGFRPFVALVETRGDQVRSARLIEISTDRIDVGNVLAKCRQYGLDPFAAAEGDRELSVEARTVR